MTVFFPCAGVTDMAGRPLVVARIWALLGSIIPASELHGHLQIGGHILPPFRCTKVSLQLQPPRARAVRNCESCDAMQSSGADRGTYFFTASVRWSLVGLWSGKHDFEPQNGELFFSPQHRHSKVQAVITSPDLKTFAKLLLPMYNTETIDQFYKYMKHLRSSLNILILTLIHIY